MNIRDDATDIYFELDRCASVLEDIQNAEDFTEAECIASEIACDIRTLMDRVNSDFSLEIELG